MASFAAAAAANTKRFLKAAFLRCLLRKVKKLVWLNSTDISRDLKSQELDLKWTELKDSSFKVKLSAAAKLDSNPGPSQQAQPFTRGTEQRI